MQYSKPIHCYKKTKHGAQRLIYNNGIRNINFNVTNATVYLNGVYPLSWQVYNIANNNTVLSWWCVLLLLNIIRCQKKSMPDFYLYIICFFTIQNIYITKCPYIFIPYSALQISCTLYTRISLCYVLLNILSIRLSHQKRKAHGRLLHGIRTLTGVVSSMRCYF